MEDIDGRLREWQGIMGAPFSGLLRGSFLATIFNSEVSKLRAVGSPSLLLRRPLTFEHKFEERCVSFISLVSRTSFK
jgi:hypothetical protein